MCVQAPKAKSNKQALSLTDDDVTWAALILIDKQRPSVGEKLPAEKEPIGKKNGAKKGGSLVVGLVVGLVHSGSFL